MELREARRDFTRRRICEAARKVFDEFGVDGGTMEQIASAAGTRRSTLYNHFRDKDAILKAIADDFGTELIALTDQALGPCATFAEIDAWVRCVAEFVKREKTPTLFLLQLGMSVDVPPAMAELGSAFIHAMAEKIPAFAKASERDSGVPLIRARASAALRQLGTACAIHARAADDEMAEAALTVAAEMIDRFVKDHSDDRSI